MTLIKRLFGGRIEGKVKFIMEPKKGIISEGKRIAATVLSLGLVAALGWKGYTMPAESASEIAMALVAAATAILTAWSKITKK